MARSGINSQSRLSCELASYLGEAEEVKEVAAPGNPRRELC